MPDSHTNRTELKLRRPVHFTPTQIAEIQELRSRTGSSFSEIVRQAVSVGLRSREKQERDFPFSGHAPLRDTPLSDREIVARMHTVLSYIANDTSILVEQRHEAQALLSKLSLAGWLTN